jgi:hypothetical protein
MTNGGYYGNKSPQCLMATSPTGHIILARQMVETPLTTQVPSRTNPVQSRNLTQKPNPVTEEKIDNP